jgi:hypothetical protein
VKLKQRNGDVLLTWEAPEPAAAGYSRSCTPAISCYKILVFGGDSTADTTAVDADGDDAYEEPVASMDIEPSILDAKIEGLARGATYYFKVWRDRAWLLSSALLCSPLLAVTSMLIVGRF